MMTDDEYVAAIEQHARDMTVEEQRKVGAPTEGTMEEEHKNFLQTLITLIDSGKIDVYVPETMLHKDVYDHLDDEWREKVDISMANLAHQLRRIHDFYHSTDTPNESPQLQIMVEHVWQMKQRIEVDEEHDVFKF